MDDTADRDHRRQCIAHESAHDDLLDLACWSWRRLLQFLWQWLLAQMSIDQFLDERHALELPKLGILTHSLVERHAHLPRAREDFRIFDDGLVQQRVWTGRRIALGDLELIAV